MDTDEITNNCQMLIAFTKIITGPTKVQTTQSYITSSISDYPSFFIHWETELNNNKYFAEAYSNQIDQKERLHFF